MPNVPFSTQHSKEKMYLWIYFPTNGQEFLQKEENKSRRSQISKWKTSSFATGAFREPRTIFQAIDGVYERTRVRLLFVCLFSNTN
jgi:hypothetical protein